MALNVCQNGEMKLLAACLAAEDRTLNLYSNSHTPSNTDTAAAYTACTFAGYTAVTLYGSAWTTPSINSSGNAVSTQPQVSWTCTDTGQSVQGYFVLSGDSSLVWAEQFSTPRTLGNTDVLNFTPQMTLSS